ncbi:MAG: hypothetical protein VYA55_22230 [Pseudomonadota bacterium]|nr:hypothetical protein [Pseudomonadota bacterium]
MAETLTPQQVEEQQARARRQQRKNAKKKHAAARDAFLEESTGFVDRDALHSALEMLMEREGLNLDEATDQPGGAAPQPRALAMGAPAPMAFPANNTNRWNPIGPSVVRQGQADGRPRVSGRVRDLAVSNDGQRAYAATAKGGVWYTGDGGATWEPVGGWASEPRRRGGNTSAFACGCLLVNFGAAVANDFVMVGTGEIGARQRPANWLSMRGMGVLVATGPASQAIQNDPWEAATGINLLEGVSIVRMVRVPGTPAGQNGDQVIAATTGGLFLGTRSMVGGSLAYTWAAMAAPPIPATPPAANFAVPPPANWAASRDPTDLLYVGNRLFVCFRDSGVAFSDNNGGAFNWITMNFAPAAPAATARLVGRMSLALNDDNNRVYVLGEVDTNPGALGNAQIPHVWQIANPAAALPGGPVATPLNNVPTNGNLWPGQRDYDQAILATTYTPAAAPPGTRTDRVYIGGSLVWVANWNAAIWCFDVNGANLVPSPGVSDRPPGTTHGADTAGLVGNHVHPDVHTLRKANNADGSHQVWVGCDGGVFLSLRNGQTNTFSSRNVGLASIESEFMASHPTSSHFAMLGCQDNGRQVRVGDSVWEMKTSMQGDGGGVMFHPVQSHYVLGQFTQADWACDPAGRYVPPAIPPNAANPAGSDPEFAASFFYSGIDAIPQPAGNRARVALGTNRVWITDNLGTANPNTWRVLPITALTVPPTFANARDPRLANRLPNAAQAGFGVPPGFGPVITVKWVNPTTVLALYHRGVVRYTENPGTPGQWTSTNLLQPGMAAVAPLVVPNATFFTDIAPVPGTNDFYLTGTGQTRQWTPAVPATPTSAAVAAIPPTAALDTCYYYDDAAGGFRTTGLGNALPTPVGLAASPIDPAYSVVVDPVNVNNVYVGTATAVWTATKGGGNIHGAWLPFVNGLPESTVQDLHIWSDPAAAAGSPRLLRAALQSRGVWEVNLAAAEPSRTYLRVHERDDRRMFPTPLKNPRRHPAAADVAVFCSPDIVIRPETPVTNTPSFQGTNLTNNALTYQLWTFQTAFRWLFPSIIPNGEWSDQFGDLVERHRRALGLPNAGSRRVDAALWNSVMANGQDENGRPGVYRAPWQNALAPTLPASEIDLMETVVPRRDTNNIWQVYRERSVVDILLHHRDTRPVPANDAFGVLLWRHAPSHNTLLATDCTDIVPYVRSLVGGGAPLAVPAGWNVALTGGNALHRLSVPLAARMPRAVSANVDLSAVPNGRRVLLLALAGSTADAFSAVPSGTITRVDDFVRHWPHAAARIISVWPRPGTQLF